MMIGRFPPWHKDPIVLMALMISFVSCWFVVFSCIADHHDKIRRDKNNGVILMGNNE